jgi:tricarballylate dehydrogenase
MSEGRGYDLVVVGFGGAGLSAALGYADTAAGDGRSARIAVLERAPREERGGATRWTTARLRINDDDELDPHVVDRVASSHRDADRGYMEVLQREMPTTIRTIEEHGVELVHYPLGLATNIAEGREASPIGGGAAIVDALGAAVEAIEGCDVLYETEAVELVLDDDGAIAGLRVRGRDGRLRTLAAPAVVLACGGFEGSKEMLTRYLGPRACDMPVIAPGLRNNVGDGLRMATAIGGDTAGQFDMFHGEPVDSRTDHPDAVVLAYPFGIVVNERAERFFDEGVDTLDNTFEVIAYEIWRHQANTAYFIGDQTTAGVPHMELLNTTDLPPVSADTIGELAEGLGLDPRALEATVAEYNAAAREGEFSPFTKDGKATVGLAQPKTNWAFPIDSPPYIGYPLTTAITFTFGGVRTDEQARVLTPGGTPIPGLYAAGEVTGLFYYDYPVGISVLRGLTFGRLAGAHAAGVAAPAAAPA